MSDGKQAFRESCERRLIHQGGGCGENIVRETN